MRKSYQKSAVSSQTSYRATSSLRALLTLTLTLTSLLLFSQRVALKQLERYLGHPIGPLRLNYVGLTDTSGDQRYMKLDSIIIGIADSLIAEIPPYVDTDTDQQYFDRAEIVDDTLILSIYNDGLPDHKFDLKKYYNHHVFYEVGTTRWPDSIADYIYKYGRVTIGENAYYDQSFAVPMSDIRVHDIIIGYDVSGGSTNLRIGNNNQQYNVSGYLNVGIGSGALQYNTTGESNLAIGSQALNSNTTGIKGTAVGVNSLIHNITGNYNTGIGYLALYDMIDGSNNIGVGVNTMQSNQHGSANTAIGNFSLYQSQGSSNVAIGYSTLRSAGYNNVGIGTSAGEFATGNSNVFIGVAAGYSETGSDKLYIENTSGSSPLIYGDFAGDTVRINGSLQVTNRTGIPTILAGWRGSDNKITNVKLGTGFRISTDSLYYADVDSQYVDTFSIISNILGISLIRDGKARSTVDLTPYMDNTDNQYFDTAFIDSDTLYLSLYGDGQAAKKIDLKQYIDTAFADTDEQRIDTFEFDMDTLYISLERDNEPVHKVYLGDLITLADSDKQRFDSAFIQNDTIFLSIQRDSVNAHRLDLKPYLDDTDRQYHDTASLVNDTIRLSLIRDERSAHIFDLKPYLDNTDNQYPDTFAITSNFLDLSLTGDNKNRFRVDLSPYIDPPQTYGHAGTTSYTNTLSITGSQFSLLASTGIGISHNGTGGVTFINTGMINWLLDGSDDAFGATTITTGNTVAFQGASGITAKLAASGSSTVLISIDSSAYVDNYVDAISFNSSSLLTLGRTNALPDLSVTVMDHDWYEVGTTLPPNAITDEMFHTGKTGIGMNPVWLLDVSQDARINGHQIGVGGFKDNNSNIRFGKDALGINVSGYQNTAISSGSLSANTSGFDNTAVGFESLHASTNSFWNTAYGSTSMHNCTSCNDNTAIGFESMHDAISAKYNTAVGHRALGSNTASDENTALGDYSLLTDPSPSQNTSVGRYSMLGVTGSVANISLGYSSMYDLKDSASYNIAIGYQALFGSATSSNVEYNIGIGTDVMAAIKNSSDSNIIIGRSSGLFMDGNANIALGNSSQTNTVGNNNTTIGNNNLIGTASNNVIIGRNQSLTTSGNTVITNGLGTVALYGLSTGFVGIGGETNPTQKLHVTGNMRLTGAMYDASNSPGTSGQVWVSTVTGTAWTTLGTGGTVTSIGVAAPASGFTITPASITTAGTFTFALNNDLLALENLTTETGMMARTALNTYAFRTLTAGSGISITNANGVTGNPTISATGSSLSFSAVGADVWLTGGSSVIFKPGTGVSFTGTTGIQTTITVADVAANNEGSLTVLVGGSGTSIIHSNTAGSTDLILEEGASMEFIEIPGTNTISIGLALLDFQIMGGSATTAPLSIPGHESITLNAGTGITFSSVAAHSMTINSSASGTVTSVGLTGATGIGVTGSPITTSGTFALSLNNDLAAVEGLSSFGMVARTAANSWTTRTLTAGAGISSITFANGVSGDPTIITVDQTTTNEGSLTVGTGASNTSIINSNTSGSTGVTITAGSGLGISEVGNVITLTSSATGTVTSVGVAVPTGLGVSASPITTAGTITLSLNNDLAAVEGLSGTGIAVRTVNSPAAWVTRTLTASSGISITNADGVSGNPTIQAVDQTATNELQALSIVGNTLTIGSGGGSPNSVTVDGAVTNEGSLTASYSSASAYNLISNTSGSTNVQFIVNTTGNNTGLKFSNTGSSQIGLYLADNVDYFFAKITTSSSIVASSMQTFANDAAAGSLAVGTLYKTATGEVRIKL